MLSPGRTLCPAKMLPAWTCTPGEERLASRTVTTAGSYWITSLRPTRSLTFSIRTTTWPVPPTGMACTVGWMLTLVS